MLKTFFLILLFPVCAFSQTVKVSDVSFEFSRASVGKKNIYYKTDAAFFNYKNKLQYKYRLAVKIKNETGKTVEGLIFRYAIQSKIKKESSGTEGFWGVPFLAEEIRVSKIIPGGEKTVYISNLEIGEEIKKIQSSGFEIEAFRADFMKEPKKEDEAVEITSKTVPLKKI